MVDLTIAWNEKWLWIGGSVVLAVIWTNVAWFFRRQRSGVAGEAVADLIAWRFSPWLFQLLRMLYYVGVPSAALLWGHDAVLGRLLGLQRLVLPTSHQDEILTANWLDWTHDAGWAFALAIGASALLALGWWAYRRALVRVNGHPPPVQADFPGWVLPREAVFREVHWAFYRNAPIVAWGPYHGVWAGLALVALEAALDPAWRKGLSDPELAPVQLMRAALAVVSSLLFLLTQNLWLAVPLHSLVSWGLATLYQASSRPTAFTNTAATDTSATT